MRARDGEKERGGEIEMEREKERPISVYPVSKHFRELLAMYVLIL